MSITRIYDDTLCVFNEMWDAYQKELKEPRTEFNSTKNVNDYIIIEEGKIVGFIFVCEYPDSFSPLDIFISGLYIKPEYRHRGYAEKAVLDIIEEYDSCAMSLFVSKKNNRAIDFWEHIMKKNGFTERFCEANVSAGVAINNEEFKFLYYLETS